MMKVRQKKAFTLPEVLVAMSIIILVIFTATNLVVSIIRSNNENVNTLVAYGLAQEGLEAMRNIRDSDWLLGIKFDGTYKSLPVWGASLPAFPESIGVTKYYTVQLNNMEVPAQTTANVSISQLEPLTPWKITEIASSANQIQDADLSSILDGKSEKTLLYVQKDPSFNESYYVHSSLFQSDIEPSIFHRYITVTPVEYSTKSTKFLKMRVTCVVNWMEYGRNKELKLETELTDWKEGD
jgi:prepilin-type N-terminal cleavage/methylation domain-containing protein